MSQNAQKGQKFRVGGSGYTLFSYSGSRIKFCRQIADTQPAPVANPEAVQPIDERHPIEIAFPAAVRAGTLVLTVIEEWDRDVWRLFPGFRNGRYNDLADVFDRNIRQGGVTCVKVIKPPRGSKRRLVMYHNAVITNIDMSENIQIETMTIGRAVTIMYTHTTRRGG